MSLFCVDRSGDAGRSCRPGGPRGRKAWRLILSRPVDFAVTCVSADRSFMPVKDCGATDGLAVSWILDGDLDGVFVSSLPDGDHFDFDPVLPGYSPMPVRQDAVAIEPSPDSRYVFVASNGGVESKPALTLIDGDFFSMAGAISSVDLPCPLSDMTVMEDAEAPAGYAIAALLSCTSGSQVWRLEPPAGDLRSLEGSFVSMGLVAGDRGVPDGYRRAREG